MMTRANFLKEYRSYLAEEMPWAKDAAKLDKFMVAVEETLSTTKGATWDWNSHGPWLVFGRIGGKGKLTLKALRALP